MPDPRMIPADEARLADGWRIVDPHPTNPDYNIMTRPVED